MPGPIVSRAQWGARFPDGFGLARNPATELWLHHSVTTPAPVGATLAMDVVTIQRLEEIGQERFGGGISYTFCVTPAGRIFEGHSVTREGAHTYGHNTVGRGIVLVGNYNDRAPNIGQLDAIRWLIAHGYHAHWWTLQRLTGGHRDVKQTDCPGNLAYAAIPIINIPWPSTPPAPPPVPLYQDGETMSEVDVCFYDDSWHPDDAGLHFRAVTVAEVGSNSQVVARSWIRWAAHWGTATFSVLAWDVGQRPLAMPIHGDDYAELPPGTRKVTIEGTRSDVGVRISVGLLVMPK